MHAAVSPAPTPRSTPQSVVLVALITAVCLMGDSMLYVALPIHWESAGLSSLWEVGILLSINRFVRLPLNPLVSWLYNRISLRNGLILATLLAGITTFAYGQASSFAFWLVLRSVWGVAWTFLKLGAFFIILEVVAPERRGTAMGLYNGLYRLGSLVGMLAGGILADIFGLSVTALIFGLCTLTVVVPAFLFLPRTRNTPPAQSSLGLDSTLLHNRHLMWVMTTGMLVALAYQGLFAATASRLVEAHAGSVILVLGVAVGCTSLAGALQSLRWAWEPWLAPWFGKKCDSPKGRHRILVAGLLSAGCLLGLATLSLPLPLWLVVLLGVQLAGTALTTVADVLAATAAAADEKKHRSIMSNYILIVDLGAAFGPMLAYAVAEFFGIDAAYALTGALLALLGLRWLRSPAAPDANTQ